MFDISRVILNKYFYILQTNQFVKSMSFGKRCSAFVNNECLAYCSPDGVLHVWNVATGEQKHQYIPASHLTSTFTCLSWKVPNQKSTETSVVKPKKKRSKPSELNPDEAAEFIALGTVTGDVVLFNILNGELVSKFSRGHSDQVNDISWGKNNVFYSCSNDQNIVEWNLSSPSHKCKWQADKREVYSICVGPHAKTLLSAGKTIKLWDLKSKTMLKRFVGHTSPVHSLSFVNIPSLSSRELATPIEIVDGLYFLSAALEDRSLSAWQIKSMKHKKIAACSFGLPSEPCLLDVMPPVSQDHPAHLLAVTEDDQIIIFIHTLNGHLKKPLLPTRTIKIVTEDATPLQIVCATFKKDTKDGDVIITVAFGSTMRVAFEQVNLKLHDESDVVLIRKDPSKTEVIVEEDKMKLKQPIKGKKVTSITPGVVGHSGEKSKKKRKKLSSLGESQLTMEERITALTVDTVSLSSDPPTADSFALLLSQGLQSNDHEVLNQVLQHGNESLIHNTVKQIPIKYIIPLVKELTERLHGNPEKCLIFIKWMRATLNHHSSYLMTFPDIVPLLSRLYQLMNARTQTNAQLCRLQGKLELIASQVAARQAQTTEKTAPQSEALYVFEEDSSDEQEDMEGITIDPSQDDDEDNFHSEMLDEDSDEELSSSEDG